MRKPRKLTELKITVYEDGIVLRPKMAVTQYQIFEIICALIADCPKDAVVGVQSVLMDYEKRYRITPADKDK